MALTLPAFAKINLDLRVLGSRPDGYHDLKTIFQALALHDSLTLEPTTGRFEIICSDPSVPTDHRNLVWKAADLLWRTAQPRRGALRNVRITLRKRIPAEAGLGGGSSDAAVTLLGLSTLWKLPIDLPSLARIGGRLGADVPFFLVGGTALGLGRGDDIYPLTDLPRTYAVIVRPAFGVSTAEAYGWLDRDPPRRSRAGAAARPVPVGWPAWSANLRNDLEPAVVKHHPVIARIRQSLVDAGAVMAAMSGSGSAVFGLFERPDAARRTAADLARPGWRVVWTPTLSRTGYRRRLRLVLAGSRISRIS